MKAETLAELKAAVDILLDAAKARKLDPATVYTNVYSVTDLVEQKLTDGSAVYNVVFS